MTTETADLFGSVLTEIAETKRAGDDVTEPLMRRLREKGMTLEEMGGSKIMSRSQGTMRKHARELGMAFPDYVPRDLKTKTIKGPKRESGPAEYCAAHRSPGYIVLLRMGDFFEGFDADAEVMARDLGLVVTSRDNHPMCGFPVHAAEDYLKKLAMAGHRVAIIEPRKRERRA